MGLVNEYMGHLPAEERERILGGICAHFYGIE
jgi:hypothetical protein